ncbi:tetratricopeptide repeat protein, partial [candidate division WOR-3 bacterium]|nr:tetratricopeptide repeat protein [candidate division WOR-3 bacterium]
MIQEPENHEFLSELAFSLSKIDNLKEAEKYAKLALKYGSTDKNLYIILGNGAKERDEKKIAVSFYKKALSDTSNYFLIINLAQLMRELNEMDDAIELLRALKTRYPFDLRIHTQLADIFGRVEKFDLAKREFNEALVIDSLYYPAILGLGIIYEIIGDIDSSLIFYRKASQVNPNNINMLKRIVEFNIIKGGWDEARDNALTILNLSPVENTVRKQLAYALFRLQDIEGSLEQYLLLSGLIPDDMSVHHFLGRLYYKKNEMEKAREQFERSLSLNPEFIPNIEYLYLIALKEGDDEKEDYFFHELLQKGVKTENLFFSIGMNFYTEQDYSMAKSFLLKSVKENPKFPNPFYTLGFVYDKLGVLDSAELSYRKVIELDSMNANAYNALGYLFVEHAVKLDEAEKLIK